MKYIIFPLVGKKVVAFCNSVAKADAAYLQDVAIPKMRSLTDEEYMYGPAGILRTSARASHILDGKDVHWCIEWNPGLLVVRFTPSGKMHYVALRSPDPSAFGRKATKKELAGYDEDAENPQYNLVFHSWDPEHDEISRKGWKKPSKQELDRHEAALAHANKLHGKIQEECRPFQSYDRWLKRCEESPIWKGEVVMG